MQPRLFRLNNNKTIKIRELIKTREIKMETNSRRREKDLIILPGPKIGEVKLKKLSLQNPKFQKFQKTLLKDQKEKNWERKLIKSKKLFQPSIIRSKKLMPNSEKLLTQLNRKIQAS